MNRIQSNLTKNMPASNKNKARDWQLEILMEKLRSKASQYKSLQDISKNVRMALLEKRYALDSVEKSQHQKCLDTLQHSIKVTSLQSMIERLESLTRQLGLKFVVESSGVFISSDMFYLEIVLDSSGTAKDVKIHHDGRMEQQSCTELVNCLTRGDFDDFVTQLEGFVSIYQLNAEKKIKSKAFTALESLETDLSTLAQLQMFMKEPFNLIHKSPVGILERRRGGHPMKLTYFVSPYDLLNMEKNDMDPINIESIINRGLGYNVTVCMEGSAAHKLQTSTLITVNRNINGKSTPSYSSLNPQNSAVIPACFVLKLNQPMPMCISLIRQIQQIQPWTEIDNVPPQPLLNLIVNHSSDGKLMSSNNKGLFVTLPDQNHCYFMTENKTMNGVLVNSIPFTHPAHVPNILKILREQALFNTIISSCVRPNSRQDFDNMTMFEVSALSPTQISISLEHPLEESMATAEVDLADISSLICHIHNPGTPPPVNAPDTVSELATKILNKTFSIPVTLRSVIKMWDRQSLRRQHYGTHHENFSLPLGSIDPGGGHSRGSGPTDFGGGLHTTKQEPTQGNSTGGHHPMMQAHQGMWNDTIISSNFPNFPPSEAPLTSVELADILSGGSEKSQTCASAPKSHRTSTSSRRKVGEDLELAESSSCDSVSRSTPVSQEADEAATPNSGLAFQSDLELSGLDPSELLGSTDKSQSGFENLDGLGDMDEMLVDNSSRKSDRSPSNSSSLSEFGDKTIVPPNVSITPVSTSPSPSYTSNPNSEKRNIEILPIAQSAAPLLPSSITITPVAQSQKNVEERKEKKSSKSSKDEKSRLEKKRKRKRDDSPMGPPEKLPPKQDPLSKPVTVSIKPAKSPPLPGSTPTSPNTIRKFSVSPTPNRSVPISGKLSPSLMKPGLKSSSSSHLSPKHSPAHVPSSPKHSNPLVSSPKSHHGNSPKHPSTTASSGKPSMTTLKNAASSPSSKTGSSSSEKSKSATKDAAREKDKTRNVFGISNSNKKSSSLKAKALDMNASDVILEGIDSPTGIESKNPNQVRNRKGSLSAIVDKLKGNAQHCDATPTDLSSKQSSATRERTTVPNKDNKTSAKVGDVKNSEYMVKPSLDGMKLTINKTRAKESSKSSSSSSSSSSNSGSGPGKTVTTTGSTKIHTGLKPGVNSGPASKKPQALQKSNAALANSSASVGYSIKSSTTSGNGSNSGSSMKPAASVSPTAPSATSGGVSKSNSMSMSKTVSKSSSPKLSSGSDLARSKDRPKTSKSASEKSIFSAMKDRGKCSPIQSTESGEGIYKMQNNPYSSPLMMEGMIKALDKNFQIPKLSARNSEDKKLKSEVNNMNRSTVDTKIFDMITKNDIPMHNKYPIPIPAMNSLDQKIRNNMNNMVGSTPKVKDEDEDKNKKDTPQNLSSSQGPPN